MSFSEIVHSTLSKRVIKRTLSSSKASTLPGHCLGPKMKGQNDSGIQFFPEGVLNK